MASILRHTAVWSGTPGLPGYTQFYQLPHEEVSSSAQTGHVYLAAFFDALASLIPDDVTVTLDPVVQRLDEVTGDLLGELTVETPEAPIVGTYVSGWLRQMGVLVEWSTGVYIGGKRLRGRTYLVPLGNIEDSDGTLPVGTLSQIQAAANGIPGPDVGFSVWHRPVNGAGGASHEMTGATVRDKACILRSRMI